MEKINQLSTENRMMKDKINEQGSTINRVSVYQEKIITLSIEIERLNRSVLDKDDEIGRLKRKDNQNSDKL